MKSIEKMKDIFIALITLIPGFAAAQPKDTIIYNYKGGHIIKTATYYFKPAAHTFKKYHKPQPDFICSHTTVYQKGLHRQMMQLIQTGHLYRFRNFKKSDVDRRYCMTKRANS